MLKSVKLSQLTVFQRADLDLSERLNVFVGENGTGKTHLLKVIYAMLAASSEERHRPGQTEPTKGYLEDRLGEKLVAVFRCDTLGSLIRSNGKDCRIETDRLCSLEDVMARIDADAPTPTKRGPSRK